MVFVAAHSAHHSHKAHRPPHDEPADPEPGSLPVDPDEGAGAPLIPSEPEGEPVPDPKV